MFKMKNSMYFIMPVLLFHSFIFSQSSNITPIEKWAKILVNYSLNLQAEETLEISSGLYASELCLAIYKEALIKGAYPTIVCELPVRQEIFYKNASEKQLKYVDPIKLERIKYYNAVLYISAPSNRKELSNVEPYKRRIVQEAQEKYIEISTNRRRDKHLKWCVTSYPTNALAQEAEMGLNEYTEFVFQACKLNEANPEEEWQKVSLFQQELCEWLKGKDKIIMKGPNIDIEMNIKGRSFVKGDGRVNFPDGEIYISPVENSAKGWIKFNYPAIFGGREVNNVQLWFKEGKVIKEKAEKGEEYLTEILNTDGGSRVLGELGIGTNYHIRRFTKMMLFDEKMGGTIHIAVGSGFPESGGLNKSAVHWDMLCDMAEGEIRVDNELFYKNGQFVQ